MIAESPLLSVIVPIASDGRVNPKLAQNLANLIRLNHQVIIVIDGDKQSLDVLSLVSELGKVDEATSQNISIHYVNFRNPGMSRNYGLKLASKPWIAFWDSDDIPDVFETLLFLQELKTSGLFVGIARARITSCLNSKSALLCSDLPAIARSPGLWRCIFHRSTLRGISFKKLSWGEDILFVLEVLVQFQYFQSQHITYHYLSNQDSSLSSQKENAYELLKLNNLIWTLAQNHRTHITNLFVLNNSFSLLRHGFFRHAFTSILQLRYFSLKSNLLGIKSLVMASLR